MREGVLGHPHVGVVCIFSVLLWGQARGSGSLISTCMFWGGLGHEPMHTHWQNHTGVWLTPACSHSSGTDVGASVLQGHRHRNNGHASRSLRPWASLKSL